MQMAAAARASRQRRVLSLAGSADWCRAAAQVCLDCLESVQPPLWIGTQAPEGVRTLAAQQAHQILGSEVTALVMDAHSGFDPDAFGAAAGSLVGGGLLLLLSPPLQRWPDFDDPEHARIAVAPVVAEQVGGRFLQRLTQQLSQSDDVVRVQQGESLPVLPVGLPVEVAPAEPNAGGPFSSRDQQRAVEALLRVVHGHRRRPLVLSADRGRGKSSAFGLAAAELLRVGKQRILVTAPRLSAVDTLFEQAHAHLPGSLLERATLRWENGVMEFIAPDELLAQAPEVDLVLVDEAAGIPLAMLERMLRSHARIAFASTVYGYEGTGRGFALKFQGVLDQHTPGWQALEMHTPVRWAPDDPLERLVFRALLLNAAIAEVDAITAVDLADCRFERLRRDALVQDEVTLSQLFGLLVLSHYRTRPFDLRHLLDGPNLEIYVLRHGETLLATALLAREGELDAAIVPDIYAGRRRLQGHLLPQSMLAHVGAESAAGLRYGRIMRIAVHPALQGQGLGSRLLAELRTQAEARDWAFLGASFGASAALLRFWRRAGFTPLRVGMTREASSGAHAALMLQALNESAQELLTVVHGRFQEQLLYGLSDNLRELDMSVVAELLDLRERVAPALSASQWREVETFANGLRGFEDSVVAIHGLFQLALQRPDAMTILAPEDYALLVKRLLQRQPWSAVARELGLAGKAAAITAARAAVRRLLVVRP